jgi:hypothetical protein
MNGRFELGDEFTSTEIVLYSNVIRTPRERWYDLTSTPGSLTVRARAVDLESLDQPSSQGSPILLKIAGRGGRYDFYYATRAGRRVVGSSSRDIKMKADVTVAAER